MYAARLVGRRYATVTRLTVPKKNAIHIPKRSLVTSPSTTEYGTSPSVKDTIDKYIINNK
jgi:hypothetical protein